MDLMRSLFRQAQQAWTRAARWQAIMGPQVSSPSALVVALIRSGAWPLGMCNGRFHVLHIAEEASELTLDPDALDKRLTRRGLPRKNRIFISGRFQDARRTNALVTLLRVSGLTAEFHPVPERAEPIEPQLGRRIMEAQCLLALKCPEDLDFGRPWWVTQELEFATHVGTPVIFAGDEIEECASAIKDVIRGAQIMGSRHLTA